MSGTWARRAVLAGQRSIVLTVVVAALVAGSGLLDATTASAAPKPTPAATASSSAVPSGAGSTNSAGGGVTFGIGPASATKIDGRSSLNVLASPGAVSIDHVGVENFGTAPVTLDLYAADAENSQDGSLGWQAKADHPVDAGAWITLATSAGNGSITLGPRSLTIVPVKIAVPGNASPGDHSAGILASITSKVEGSNGIGPNFEQRVAVRTFIRVSGPIHPGLTVQGLHASYSGTANPFGSGKAKIDYTVKNTGNVNLGGKQSVKISGLFGGTGSVKAVADVPLLLPGSSFKVHVTANNVWPEFLMHAKVSIAPVKPASDVDPGLSDVTTSASFWAVPWSPLGLLVILLLIIAAIVAWRIRVRRRPARGGRHGNGNAGQRQPVPVG
ncbi:MAG: DUF916 domain-containing protein [Actinobacteria bacterium]|nr:DUF916 domain-containing protein [Actinomycetota bacterium]